MNMNFSERAATLEVTACSYSVRKALRKAGALIRKEASIGLIIPRDRDVTKYADALRSVLRSTKRAEVYTQCTVEVSHRGNANWLEAADILKAKPGVVLLIPHGVTIPPEIRVSLDEVIQVEPIRPVHLVAAIKSSRGEPTTAEEARMLLSYPMDLMFQALRPGRSVQHALVRLSDAAGAKAERLPLAAMSFGVEELPGFGQAKEWALGLAEDLRDWAHGSLAWSDIDCGLLLSGPPGTGKTMFAQAVAKTCGAAFVSASCATWQAKGHLGDFLAAMKKTFSEAAAKAPCILFLDEFDAVGDRAKFSGDNANYCVQVVNGILEALDGSPRRDGVVVIAATNYPDAIDPALRRPGRLDRHIKVELPDHDARKDILTLHLGTEISADVLARSARATRGYSGAALAQLARDARKQARRARRSVTADDVRAVTPSLRPLDPSTRRAACVHEAGHAVVGTELAYGEIAVITVVRELSPCDDSAGHVAWRLAETLQRSRESYANEIAMILGGRAAEEVILGFLTDGSGGMNGSDLHRAADIATVMEATLGMGYGLSYSYVRTSEDLEKLRRSDPVLRKRVEKLLNAELERAKEIVRDRRADVERLAKAVMERELLSGLEMRQLLRPCSE
ncbi:AAA family ATPase [Rhizobium leguminosarum]|uniref:AAA family ATPase n=1 Tax=Rhizobium TaxID=379 RepID=UPI0010322D7F|nr:AAA family ATPase [Rhizobium leguminosarum]NEJ21610.1 AAA family ATPase [Rhizobium leguminosarum]TAY38559.1 AAA family ATPase [Rhizobium leguminosarum]